MNGKTAATMSLGFLFIAVTEWLSSATGAGWYPGSYATIVVATSAAIGVVGLFIVGILALREDDALDGTLFLGWAAFFFAELIAYHMPGVHVAGLMAWFVLFWGIFGLFLWIAALGSGLVRSLFLFTQWVALILIAASTWTGSGVVETIGYYVALVSALLALYQAAGTIVNFSQDRVLLHGCGFVEDETLL